jgi:tetratricopeptide (TPR) repeat protein
MSGTTPSFFKFFFQNSSTASPMSSLLKAPTRMKKNFRFAGLLILPFFLVGNLPGLSPALSPGLWGESSKGQKKSKPRDQIRKVGGQAIRNVQILEEGILEVKYKRGGKENTVPSDEVLSIEWKPVPDSFQRAVLAEERQEYHLAANLFEDASSSASREPLKTACEFRASKALAFHALGNPSQADAAATALQAWIQKHPAHRNTPLAYQLLGNVLLLAGKPKEALTQFDQLDKLSNDKSLSPAWSARGTFGKARALVQMKDYQKARGAYLSASTSLSSLAKNGDPAIQALLVSAKVGEGECYIAEGRNKEARRYFSNLQTKAGPLSLLLSAAQCGEGQALLEMGKSEKDKKLLRKAQVLFCEVSATDIHNSEATAKARFLLGKLILLFGRKGEGADFGVRSTLLFEDVAQGFPNSPWGLKAQSMLKKK